MWLTLKYFLGLFLRLSYWWARDYIWTDLCLALIKHFTEGNYIKQWSRREMVLPWAKIKNNHLQLFIFFFFFLFLCTGPSRKALPCCKFLLIFVLSRRGRCWLICGRRGANLRVKLLVQNPVKEVAWQRQTQTSLLWISIPVQFLAPFTAE